MTPGGRQGGGKRVGAYAVEADSEVYIHVGIAGRQRLAVLDTGSKYTLVPSRMVPKSLKLREVKKKLVAANNTPIEVEGEIDLQMKIGRHTYTATAWVSNHVEEFLLGYEWLKRQRCVWDFANKQFSIQNENVPLLCRPARPAVRRIYSTESIEIPADCQRLVPVKCRVTNIRSSRGEADFIVEPVRINSCVISAWMALSDSTREPAIAVMNLGSKSVVIPAGTNFGHAEVAMKGNSADGPIIHEGDGLDHVKGIISRLPGDLTERQRQRALEIIQRTASSFSRHDFDLGRTSLVEHEIDTGDARPVKEQLRRYPQIHQEFIDAEVDRMLKYDVIEPCASPWASNCVIVQRKGPNARLRLCIDYRKLNAVTYKDSYPILRVDTCLDALGGSSWFSSLDLRSGYWQAEINEKSRDKTAFITRRGQFRFKVLSFGLTNAVSMFMRLQDRILRGMNFLVCLCFLDDILVYGRSFEEHAQRLEMVIERMSRAGLKFNPDKCSLFQRKVKFLGYEVSSAGVNPDPGKVAAIVEWPVPRDIKEVRGWLGMIGYYRRWIRDFAKRARPLFDLLKKDAIFRWERAQQSAFEDMKNCLVTAPILGLPMDEGKYTLDVDSSGFAVGAVLSQQQGDELKVLAYASRTLVGAEVRYDTHSKETLAAMFGLKQFKHYLLGRSFDLRTDNAALTYLLKSKEVTGRQARYLDFVAQFGGLNILHRSGQAHKNADALSGGPGNRWGWEEERWPCPL